MRIKMTNVGRIDRLGTPRLAIASAIIAHMRRFMQSKASFHTLHNAFLRNIVGTLLGEGYRRISQRDLNLADIRHMVSTTYVDYLPRPNAPNLVAGRRDTMLASGESDRSRTNGIECPCVSREGISRETAPFFN